MSTLRLRNAVAMMPLQKQQLTDEINFDIAIEKFANKKTRKVTVRKNVVFISEIKMVLIFYTFTIFSYFYFYYFLLFFPILLLFFPIFLNFLYFYYFFLYVIFALCLTVTMFEFFGAYSKHTILIM